MHQRDSTGSQAMDNAPAGLTHPSRQSKKSLLAPLHGQVWAAMALLLVLTAAMHSVGYIDYVGQDNDDVMRLVQVRDLVAGQGWFDLVQHRLGLEGGTLMHWSRLIDLPIASLIFLFTPVIGQIPAEATALFVWPLITVVPVFYALALGGRSLGGPMASVIGLVAAFLFVLSINRFQPGSIDHHNVQLAIMATIAACLTLPGHSPRAFALAGFAAALAISIGAETTPHIAIAAAIVALLWVWHGEKMKAAAVSFALAMASSLSAFFYLTVPPARYGDVACDTLSTAFYSLGVVGAGGLFLAASLMSGKPLSRRIGALGAVGVATAILTVFIAPGCLGNPLGNLDPLLVEMWLNSVTEAQPVWAQLRAEPATAGGFYAVPLIAMAFCIARIGRRERTEAHLVLLALISVSYAIALVQVRGAVFANLLSAFPLVAFVADLRIRANADPRNIRKGLAFAGMALASIPFVWALGGALMSIGYETALGRSPAGLPATEEPACASAAAMAELAREPVGVVAAASNLGAHILRFTPHRALSGPYHRNQGGMLTELHTGLSEPVDAVKFLRGAGVTLVAFCKSDPQVESIAEVAPRGLYAELARGHIPDFLEKVPGTANKGLEIFRVRP